MERSLFMNSKVPSPSSFLAERKGASEIVAAIIVFAATLAVSSISITFLYQKANLVSEIVVQEFKKVLFERLATVKIVDVLKTDYSGVILVLYNPSDLAIHITAIILDDSIQQLSAILEPTSLLELYVQVPEDKPLNRISLLTTEGVLINVEP